MKRLITLALALILALGLVACGTEPKPAEKIDVKVATLKGPTGIGMVQLMKNAEEGTAKNNYTFSLESAPDAIQGLIVNADVQIAAVPTNLAAALYKKTNGAIQVAAVNTLGVLHIIENGNTINSVEDLRGKTIYATGQASTPEYILNYVLTKSGLTPGVDVTIEYMSEHSELATALASGTVAIGMLPEPNVTSATNQNKDLRIAIDLTAAWEAACGEGNVPVQGCIVVQKEFAENNKAALDAFLEEYAASVNFVNESTDDASALVETYGIMAKAALAKKAIPNCNIVFKTGDEMKTMLSDFFKVLFDANPKSIGGALPDDAFYYKK